MSSSIGRSLVAIAVAVTSLTTVAYAREPLLTQIFRNNSNLLRFSIVDGRLALLANRMPNMELHSGGGNDLKEVLKLHDENGRAKVVYERTTNEEHVTLKVSGAGGDNIVITRAPRGKATFLPMEFKQTPGEGILFTLGTADQQQVCRAPGLWHLFIMQPKECQQHLIPVLDILRANWNLAEVATAVEASLVDAARQDTAATRARWDAMVKQLGDDRFALREAADRALRAGGADSLQYLRRVDFQRLDAEQEFRIRRIIRMLAGETDGDSADAAAAALMHDRLVWLALLGRSEVATRQIAAQRLTQLLGQPIGVDPAAEPDTQKAAREQLRAKLEKK